MSAQRRKAEPQPNSGKPESKPVSQTDLLAEPIKIPDSFAFGALGEFPVAQPMTLNAMIEEMFNADLSNPFFPLPTRDPFQ